MAAEQFTAEELTMDESEPRRLLGNAQACLWDINREELTARESKRLTTINNKIDELEEIIKQRELKEFR